ncbi:probable succinate dehydrogenase assembly factor 1, mitochondrial at N-terminal half [Coccomyxa sp. Obi]|nr:probable succinate dehydrogenase assembly factor 1, mitochondrial at N-terminal half [Coccomyxa sp. Obi]
MMAAPRMTGLQRQVIHLYRRVMRHSRTRSSDERDTIMTHARKEFDRYRNVDKKNYQLIEHLLRKGAVLRCARYNGMEFGMSYPGGVGAAAAFAIGKIEDSSDSEFGASPACSLACKLLASCSLLSTDAAVVYALKSDAAGGR